MKHATNSADFFHTTAGLLIDLTRHNRQSSLFSFSIPGVMPLFVANSTQQRCCLSKNHRFTCVRVQRGEKYRTTVAGC
jgi:hypothetical protein